MGHCTLCLSGGRTVCTNLENTKLIQSLCKEMKIDFDKCVGFDDPLNPLPLVLPLCSECQEMLTQLSRIQGTMKKLTLQLDRVLTEIRGTIISVRENSVTETTIRVRELRDANEKNLMNIRIEMLNKILGNLLKFRQFHILRIFVVLFSFRFSLHLITCRL